MRKWTLAILLVVLGLLLGAVAAGWFLRQSGPPPATGSPCSGAAVIVLNRKADSGTAVEPDMLSTTTVRHELMLGDLIAEELAPFVAGLPLKNSLRRGDLLRWSDFESQAILEEIGKPDKAAPRKVHAVFTRGQILPSAPIRSYNAASRRDQKYFDCLVFLSGPAVLLERIQCAEYTLHETFPHPHKKICRPEADPNFSVSFSAWGTFDIPVRVTMQDGAQIEWVHGLHF
jgi:hypothetical protein